jgi:glutamate-1-semialdehyde 2,1-aminomutase
VKLARAWTGRDLVAICSDQPFFSTDDWFIGTTTMRSGIPEAIRDLTVGFRFNDLDSLHDLFDRRPDAVACVMLEAATSVEPAPGFLEGVRELCTERGAVLVFDEMITGLRWGLGGAQARYGVTPDLSAWGKGVGNGFSIAALAGRRDIMELGGLGREARDRVFLLSTTHGAETHALAATIATLAVCRREGVPEVLWQRGLKLQAAVRDVVARRGLGDHVDVVGHPANLVYVTRGPEGEPSQEYRALFMQELIRGGVLGPSFVLSYSHTEEDLDRTVEVVAAALDVYGPALSEGVGPYLVGGPTRRVFG